jgi:hypothetical protein
MLKLTTVHELKAWLSAHNIDVTAWGAGPAKSVENLWAELAAGESQLEDNPPLRQVRLVNLIIRRGNKMLVEAAQEFGDNQQRQRGLPPAEKIKPGETHQQAALRCLQEELQIDPAAVTILADTSQPRLQMQESPSYPGLRTQYWLYQVEAAVSGLPDTNFSTTESPHDDGDPVKIHQWIWQKRD